MKNKIIAISIIIFILSVTIMEICTFNILDKQFDKSIIWHKTFIMIIITSVGSTFLLYILLTWSIKHYHRYVLKNHPISEVVESFPIYISLKKDKFMKISQGQGTILKTLGINEEEIIGKYPKDILPDHIVENIQFAWEDAFEGISTNYISHINGRAYNIIVKPVHGESEFDPKPITEVVSLAIDVSNTVDNINDLNKIKLSKEIIMMRQIEKAIQNANKYDHMAAIIIIQIQGIDILMNTFNKNQIHDLIIRIADKILVHLRSGDNMVSTSEGKYIVLLSHIKKKEFASHILHNIINSVCEPTFLDGYQITMPVNNKMVLFPNEDEIQIKDIEYMLTNIIN